MQRVVALTGAGISAESGLKTFRDSDGLWEGYSVQDVATPEAWESNPELVQRFYNERREAVLQATPNAAHLALQRLESKFETFIITQNIDDLHERAGSKNVVHLHGEIIKSQSSIDPNLIYPIQGSQIRKGDLCERGSQLRPHVVWFGEAVPMMKKAIELVERADIFMVIGTSLVVYPAAGLVEYAERDIPVYLIDAKADQVAINRKVQRISELASSAVPKVVQKLLGL